MVKIHINVPKELKQELKILAATNGESMNELCWRFLDRCLSEIKKEAA